MSAEIGLRLNLDEFLTLPANVDIRPHVARAVQLHIDLKPVATIHTVPSQAAAFFNTVIADTKLPRSPFRPRADGADPATRIIHGWNKKDVSTRGEPLLAKAVFYWFFRFAPEPSYFSSIANEAWKDDAERLKRFRYAKEGGSPDDPFEAVVARLRSEKVLRSLDIAQGEGGAETLTDTSWNDFSSLAALGRNGAWAKLVASANRFEMRGIGAPFVPRFALGANVQVHINPQIDGFLSLFNVDKAEEGPDTVLLLDPLFRDTDIAASSGQSFILPSSTAGLPVGGLAGTHSILIACISPVRVFNVWRRYLQSGHVFYPDYGQRDQFGKLFLSTSIELRAVCSVNYQT